MAYDPVLSRALYCWQLDSESKCSWKAKRSLWTSSSYKQPKSHPQGRRVQKWVCTHSNTYFPGFLLPFSQFLLPVKAVLHVHCHQNSIVSKCAWIDRTERKENVYIMVGLGPDLPEIQSWPSHPMGYCPAHLHPQVLVCSVLWACDQHHTPLKLCGLPPIVTQFF